MLDDKLHSLVREIAMKHSHTPPLTRRQFGRGFIQSAAAIAIGSSLLNTQRLVHASEAHQGLAQIGELQAPDANGLRLPTGFSSRIVAQSGRYVEGTSYRWHVFPDGGATFPTFAGGWIYVSNSEVPVKGGVGAILFDRQGNIKDAYSILEKTNINCAGGATPWGTWMSCEEYERGYVWECDPYGKRRAIRRDALGMFEHEAVAVDPVNMHLYMTEDDGEGKLYRYVPHRLNLRGRPDFRHGELQVAVVDQAGYVTWRAVPDPTPRIHLGQTPTRFQVEEATTFKGGEGIWYHEGLVYFTTKGDNRVWELNVATQKLEIIYDRNTSDNPILSGVDNVTVSDQGSILVAEDGGDMQIVVISPDGALAPLVEVVGQDGSEITGPAFSPDGTRLYFSSQRGELSSRRDTGAGLTYEVTGPFSQII